MGREIVMCSTCLFTPAADASQGQATRTRYGGGGPGHSATGMGSKATHGALIFFGILDVLLALLDLAIHGCLGSVS